VLVVDASVVVAALIDDGPTGRWADQQLALDDLAAPHLMPVEVTNVLRRAELSHDISDDVAALAHADLCDLPVDLFEYELLSDRVWELRANLTSYDACYVALAEILDAPLLTLDLRVARAPGVDCGVLLPPAREPR